MTIDDFKSEELIDPEKLEEQSKTEKILAQLSFLNSYGLEQEKLEPEELNKLVRENLRELLDSCLERTPLQLGLARFLLRKATQIKTSVLQDQVIDNLPLLLPVLRDVMVYLEKTVKPKSYESIGGKLLDFLNEADLSFIPFVKLWFTHLLVDKFSEHFETPISQFCSQESDVRHLALMAKNRNYLEWVREQKEIWNNHSPWDKRAIIWSAPVLPLDERKYWLKSIENAGDKLDYIIAKAAF